MCIEICLKREHANLEQQNKLLTIDLAECKKELDKTKAKLEDAQSEMWDEGEKPDFLNTGVIPYQPIIVDENNKTVKLNPTDIYMECSFLRKLASGWRELPLDERLKQIWRYVIYALVYEYDNEENWQAPIVTVRKKKGDCFSSEEEIRMADGSIKKVKDLKEGDMVLSYDFETKSFVEKKITKIWEKGKLPIKRVFLRNGQHIDVTSGHHMFSRVGQKDSIYEKTELKDIDLTRWWKRKIPCVKKLPYIPTDLEWLNEDLCFVVGHYIAEGWHENSHVCTSGYDCYQISELLDRNNIPFSEGKNSNGVPIIRFLKSDFKEFLKKCKTGATNKQIPNEMMNLPPNKLEMLLDGYFLGDGHYSGNYKNYPNNVLNYSTCSEELSKQLQQIHLKLGRPIHVWKQENHGGEGKNTIYRLRYNSNSSFCNDYGYDNLSEVSISHIEDIGEMDCRDFEVEDTHLVIFRNGTITSQCEDGTILFVTLCRIAHVPADRVFNACGLVKKSTSSFGHSFPVCKREDGQWWIYETTLDSLPSKPMLFKGSNYDCSWGLANWEFAGVLKEGDQI